MRNEKQTRSHRLWIGRAFMLALCFAGTYVLLQWDADASLALVAFIMPLFGFLAGILVGIAAEKVGLVVLRGHGLGISAGLRCGVPAECLEPFTGECT